MSHMFCFPLPPLSFSLFESSVEILTWGWHTRQRWVTPVICWLKCSLSITTPNTELVYGVGLGSFCSRVYLLWSFWRCCCSSFWGHDIIINCFFLTTQKCLAWRSFTDWVWRPRQSSMLFRDAFAADYDCIPEATGTARITFQSLVRTSLAIDFEDCNSGVRQEPEIVHWLLAIGLKPADFGGRSCVSDWCWTGEAVKDFY